LGILISINNIKLKAPIGAFKIRNKYKITVIGLGYVGLPALAFLEYLKFWAMMSMSIVYLS